MSYRKQFTERQWQTLQFAPLWIFTLVAGVDRKLERKEVVALAKEMAEASLYKSALAQEVFQSVGLNFETVWPAYQRDSRGVLDGVKEARDLVDGKLDSSEADRFKRALIFLGTQIIEADSGGFIFKKDKRKEKVALALAAAVLGIKSD